MFSECYCYYERPHNRLPKPHLNISLSFILLGTKCSHGQFHDGSICKLVSPCWLPKMYHKTTTYISKLHSHSYLINTNLQQQQRCDIRQEIYCLISSLLHLFPTFCNFVSHCLLFLTISKLNSSKSIHVQLNNNKLNGL